MFLNKMPLDPLKHYRSRTVLRNKRYRLRTSLSSTLDIIGMNHCQRETWNRTIESQKDHRGWTDPLYKSKKNPNGIQGQLTEWRNNGEVHGPVSLQRPMVRRALTACERAWAHEQKQAERILKDIENVDKWNKENPEWDWGNWDAIGYEGRRDWDGDKPPKACDRFRDQRIPPDDTKRFRRGKDGVQTVIVDTPPERVDANTLRAPGTDIKLKVKCPKGLPPQARIRSMRIVPKGPWRDMRRPGMLRFEVHLTIETDIIEVLYGNTEIIGIDRGIINLVNLNNGEQWSPFDDEKDKRKLRKIRRDKERLETIEKQIDILNENGKQNTSAYTSAWKSWKKLNRKLINLEKTAMYDYAKSLAERYPIIVIEDLKVKNMMASARGRGFGVQSKRKLNNKLSKAKFGIFHRILKTVCENHGTILLVLPPHHSSNTCSKCHYVDKKNRKGENFKCLNCNHTNNSDINAAIVMVQRAKVYLKARDIDENGKPQVTHSKAVNKVWTYIAETRSIQIGSSSNKLRDDLSDGYISRSMYKVGGNSESSSDHCSTEQLSNRPVQKIYGTDPPAPVMRHALVDSGNYIHQRGSCIVEHVSAI